MVPRIVITSFEEAGMRLIGTAALAAGMWATAALAQTADEAIELADDLVEHADASSRPPR
jgi:hypothetical protein